jgi:hypothetical protein
VRVLVNAGPAGIKEAFVNQSTVTPTQITAVMPAINLVSTQTQAADITVIVDAGNPTEARVTKTAAFTYVTTNLTPVIRTISPTSGPIDGGTRVSIIGDAFEQPVQVFFGSAQAQVISIDFNQIIVISPTARDTNPNGSGTVTGPVEVKVINVNSGKSATSPVQFRYTPKMQITAINPLRGSAVGGTDITIDGTGFNDPVTVDIGGVRATVLRVSGTEILARTGTPGSPCITSLVNVPVTVTNVDNGDFAVSAAPQLFTYLPVSPVITSIVGAGAPPVTVGSSLTVNVQNPGIGLLGSASVVFSVGGVTAVGTPSTITTGTGTQPFNVVVPTGLTFNAVPCTTSGGAAGLQPVPTVFTIGFNNATTSCSATSNFTIEPPTNTCIAPPTAALTAPAQTCPTTPNLSPGSQTAAGTVTHSTTITIVNNGSQTLNLSAPSVAPNNATTVTVTPNTAQTVTGGNSQNYNVVVDPAAVGPDGATITFTTNDPAHPTVTVVVCGNAT